MGLIRYLQVLVHILCLALNFHLARSGTPFCHGEDMSALLQFKNSSTIASFITSLRHPKVESWPLNQTSSNCCTWEGVECDNNTGRVIALDLSSDNLFGCINSSSSLFRLLNLQRLNLAFNRFNQCLIPSGFGSLMDMTHLNLSHSFFSGQVPTDIFTLTRLVSLDLSSNTLELGTASFTSIASNLTNLQFLNLREVNISSTVPDGLASLSSLRSLNLTSTGIYGIFPASIFQLPSLELLMLGQNTNLTVYLPEFTAVSSLKTLGLLGTTVSGELPASIGNLVSLQRLEISSDNCNLTGSLPGSVGNLRSLKYLTIKACELSGSIPTSMGSLTQLTYLDLSTNPFSPKNISSLSWLWNLTNLETLYLRGINLQGEIPSTIETLSQLGILDLGDNLLSGPIPVQLSNLRQLKQILFDNNRFSGEVSPWMSNMTELTLINLQFNRLQGPIPHWITQLPNLTSVHLCFNQLDADEDPEFYNRSLSMDLPKLSSLGLASCKLRQFPAFIKNLPNLQLLDLNTNNIQGPIPQWMQNVSINSLQTLNFSFNFLTGFDPAVKALPWINLQVFDITNNMVTGYPPRPASSANFDTYLVPNNNLSGEFPSWICDLSSLLVLDLSYNKLTGTLPECLGNISTSLAVLNLQRNAFTGSIPEFYASGNQLRMISLNHNQLQGSLPRTLANCSMLEFVDLGNNQISDTFPSWLEPLPDLKVLILSHNKLHGVIDMPGSLSGFQRLRIIDLSYNMFTGMLPVGYFKTWTSMKVIDSSEGNIKYLQARCRYGFYDFYMILINKGIHLYYPKVSETFTAIDLSGNMFSGDIPNAIGDLQQLHLLNLSNNFLTGGIPSTIGQLGALESLDLSNNRLSGGIPRDLAELNFLSALNVSYNNLTGPIPSGSQLNTFTERSFEGNPGLCGDVISKKCGGPAEAKPPASENEDSSWFLEFSWEVVLLGYGGGLAVGIVIERAFNSGKPEQLATVIRRRLQRRQSRSKRGSRN